MSRRNKLRINKSLDAALPTAHEVRHQRDALLAEMRAPAFGSAAGQLYENGKLTAAEYGTAKRWAALIADYSTACRSPSAPRTVSFETGAGSSPPDPDSDQGAREAARHVRVTVFGPEEC